MRLQIGDKVIAAQTTLWPESEPEADLRLGKFGVVEFIRGNDCNVIVDLGTGSWRSFSAHTSDLEKYYG